MGEVWSDEENDAIVGDYFAMLRMELDHKPFIKSEHRRHLAPMLNKRTNGSIEFKHQNVSAVLMLLGQPWIEGYKPASQFQMSLVDAVLRFLDQTPDLFAPIRKSHSPSELAESSILYIGPEPLRQNEPPLVDLERATYVAQRYNVAERDARNRALGEAGEERVLAHEIAVLQQSDRPDLAAKVRWTSKQDGDGAGYDIASFEPSGRPRLIEVKTTNGWDRTPLHISRNELAVANDNRESWVLMRLFNFARQPKAFEIRPPLEPYLTLTPTTFLASIA